MANECPYCLSEISTGEEITVCESCGRVHHAECWREHGACASRRCAARRPHLEIRAADLAKPTLVLTREALQIVRMKRAVDRRNPCMECGKEVPEGELYCRGCAPHRDESQESRNLGPVLLALMLVMSIVLALVIANSTGPHGDSEDASHRPAEEQRWNQ